MGIDVVDDDAMLSNRVVTIDADAHVIETDHTWDFMEDGDIRYRPTSLVPDDDSGNAYWLINGQLAGFRLPTLSDKQLQVQSERTGRMVTTSAEAREMSDVNLRLAGMDQMGVDLQVLHNSLWIESTTEVPEIELALCRSWNRWMAEIHDQGEGRLFWTCVVPAYDPENAIREMRFAKEHGAVALCLRPYEGDLVVTDPLFFPLFKEATALDMSVALHIGNGSPTFTKLLKSRHPSGGGWAPFRVPTVVAAMSVITSGVSRQFPDLRWGIIEASASWVPWLCKEIQRRSGERSSAEHNPFVDNNIFVTAQVDDDIAYITQHVGPNVLMIGTDFGHTDAASEYDALVKLRKMTEIDESSKRRLMSANAAAYYSLEDKIAAIPR